MKLLKKYQLWAANKKKEEIAKYIKTNQKILDLGGGKGILKPYLKEIDKYKSLDRITGYNLDSGLLPEEDDSYDVVVASYILEHVLNPFKLLEEAKRVLKPNGTLIIVYQQGRSLTHFLSDLFRVKNTIQKRGDHSFYSYGIKEAVSFMVRLKMNNFKVYKKWGRFIFVIARK